MRSTLKFLLALAVALVSMLAFRALVFTVFTVEGGGLEPTYLTGDRLPTGCVLATAASALMAA